jgi:transcriptional regulator with XRE-family HTH domain
MTGQSAMRRRLAGTALRRYREQLGWELGDAAQVLGCDTSKVSRIETGERGITIADLGRLLGQYEVPPSERLFLEALAGRCRPAGWWDEYGSLLPQELMDFYSLEAAAAEVLAWAPWQVPAIVQAPGYARAEAEADGVPPGLLDQAGEAVAARQQAIRLQGAPRVSVVLGAEALRPRAGGQAIARVQLLALAHACEEATASPQFTVQVLPPGTVSRLGLAAGPATIVLSGRPADLGLVHVPTLHGHGVFLDEPDEVAGFSRAFTHLRSLALSPAESASLIRPHAETT